MTFGVPQYWHSWCPKKPQCINVHADDEEDLDIRKNPIYMVHIGFLLMYSKPLVEFISSKPLVGCI